ncbi:hypothetical protein V8C26DRAFT_188830 [Trichoderma gracile]
MYPGGQTEACCQCRTIWPNRSALIRFLVKSLSLRVPGYIGWQLIFVRPVNFSPSSSLSHFCSAIPLLFPSVCVEGTKRAFHEVFISAALVCHRSGRGPPFHSLAPTYTLAAVSRSQARPENTGQNRRPRLRASLFYLHAPHNSDRLSEYYTPLPGLFSFVFLPGFFWTSSFEKHLSAWSCPCMLVPIRLDSAHTSCSVLRKPQIISHPSSHRIQPSRPTIPPRVFSL